MEFTTFRFGLAANGRPLSEEATWLALPDRADTTGLAAGVQGFNSKTVTKLVLEQYPNAGPLSGWWMWLGGISELVDDPANGLTKVWRDDHGVHHSTADAGYWQGPLKKALLPGVRLITRAQWLKAVADWDTAERKRQEQLLADIAASNAAAVEAQRSELNARLLAASPDDRVAILLDLLLPTQ